MNRGLLSTDDPKDLGDLDFDADTVHNGNKQFNNALFDDWYSGLDDDGATDNQEGKRKDRLPNLFPYAFGDVLKANWYRQYLHPNVRDRIYQLSARDRFHEFRTYFRMPLAKVDDLVATFFNNGWITHSHHCRDDARLHVKAQLLILGVLDVLGSHTPFRKLRAQTEISTSEHRKFFHHFLDKMYSIKDDYIFYPRNMNELQTVMKRYDDNYLPGCGGSIDVVHLKWSNCPAGDLNRCKGKEAYPTFPVTPVFGKLRRNPKNQARSVASIAGILRNKLTFP